MAFPLDDAKWNREHYKIFSIISLSFLLDGIFFSIVPLLMYLLVPIELATLVFTINLICFTIGSFVFGRFADYYGRRLLFIVSLLIYLSSSILLAVIHSNIIAVTVLTSAINFGIGGEIGAAYSAIAEMIPARHRGKVLLLSTNFWNIGALVISGIALFYSQISQDVTTQVTGVVLASSILAVIVALARLHLPESPRWLIEKGRINDAMKIVQRIVGGSANLNISNKQQGNPIGLIQAFRKYLFRLLVLLVAQSSQLLTYNMIAYYFPYVPDFVYPSDSIPLIIMIANLGASIGAFILLPLIDKSRRVSILIAFLGGTLTSLGILLAYGQPLQILLSIILVNMVFSEFAWGTLVPLESELFPTGVRASVVGFISAFSNILTAAVIYTEGLIPSITYLEIAIATWALGFIVSLLWFIRGIESARKSVDQLS
ncbi:MAG: MFS transporter [Sulfolobaceae archaeon]